MVQTLGQQKKIMIYYYFLSSPLIPPAVEEQIGGYTILNNFKCNASLFTITDWNVCLEIVSMQSSPDEMKSPTSVYNFRLLNRFT